VADILFVTHQLAYNQYGGAETQMVKTAEAINALGLDYRAVVFDPWEHRLEDFDLIHIFKPRAFQAESMEIASVAHKRGCMVAVSPIFYHDHGFSRENMGTSERLLDAASMGLRPALRAGPLKYLDPFRFMESVLRSADVVMPNTMEEARQVEETFLVPPEKCYVVPNGVDDRFVEGDARLFEGCFGARDFILSVGRVEPRKNIFRLIEAFEASGLESTLVIMGQMEDDEYSRRCRERASSNVMFLPPIQHGSALLSSAYKAAKVVALPSYFETPGLAALEGGLAGANVVVTKKGGAGEYFGDLAWYVDPLSTESITHALRAAYTAPRREGLVQRIQKNYTWEAVARQTIEGYRIAGV
jgi:glycosyltransferase involved in cell wall biosynthesis